MSSVEISSKDVYQHAESPDIWERFGGYLRPARLILVGIYCELLRDSL